MADNAAPTANKQRVIGKPFVKGQSGNPEGRAKGSRNKLGEDFLKALSQDFDKNGEQAIIDCRQKDSVAYCRMIAKLLPKEINLKMDNPLDEYSDDDIKAALAIAINARSVNSGKSKETGQEKSGGLH